MEGGVIQLGTSGTPLDGLVVTFPAGAVLKPTKISVGYNKGTLKPNEGTFSETTLVLDAEDIFEFGMPVEITFPFGKHRVRVSSSDPTKARSAQATPSTADAVPVPYRIEEDGTLRPAQATEINRAAGTFTFITFCSGRFSWIETVVDSRAEPVRLTTGYTPEHDGFQIVNKGSRINPGGECLGMTSFSLWYFLNKHKEPISSRDFYPRFMEKMKNASENIVGQNIIATRSHTSLGNQDYFKNILGDEYGLGRILFKPSDADRYASICNHLKMTRKPVFLGLMGYYVISKDKEIQPGGGHSVLAYAYEDSGDIGIFRVYDPNEPGNATRSVVFDKTKKSWRPYSSALRVDERNPVSEYGFREIAYSGDGSFKMGKENFRNILRDAELNFQDDIRAVIELTSHASGDIVSSREVTLRGKVHSGPVLISKMDVFVGDKKFSTNLKEGGDFKLSVPLEKGANQLRFSVWGEELFNVPEEGLRYFLVQQPNNYDKKGGVILNCDVDNSVMLVTLTWDTNNTDVDLYVIDPSGDCSCYYHKKTADGGELDVDITRGYGPEHWTLLRTNTIRYGQPYKIRLHYYSDHGNGPTNYTVKVKLYEGTDREKELPIIRGNLAHSNRSNDRPDGTGPDWVDIAEITLEEAR